jgi:hypothetical protein
MAIAYHRRVVAPLQGLADIGRLTQGVALGWPEAAPLGRYDGACRAMSGGMGPMMPIGLMKAAVREKITRA